MPNDFKYVNGELVQLTDAQQAIRDAEVVTETGLRLPRLRARILRRLNNEAALAVVQRYIRLGTDTALRNAYTTIRTEINSSTNVTSLRAIDVSLPK